MDIFNEANYYNKNNPKKKSEKIFFHFLHSVSFFMITITTADTHHDLIVLCQTDTNDKLYRYTYGIIVLL